jgi:hypothetical protein
MKLVFANCTGNIPHTGCLAVTDSQVRALFSAGHQIVKTWYTGELEEIWRGDRESTLTRLMSSPIVSYLKQADGILVNGEGTIHHDGGKDLLCLLWAAQELSKPTYLVNAVLQEVEGFDDVLSKLNDLNVRESCSSAFLNSRGIENRVVFDSILDAKFSDRCDINLSGRILCTDWHFLRDRDVGRAIWDFHSSRRKSFFYPLHDGFEVFRWQHAVANFSRADAVITGRHHGAYLAGLAGVPFVVLPSNTHKIEGLAKGSKIPIPFCERPADLETKLKYAMANPSIFREFKLYLESQRPLDTFSALPRSSDAPRTGETPEGLVDAFHESIREMHLKTPFRVNSFERRFLKRRRLWNSAINRMNGFAGSFGKFFRISSNASSESESHGNG